jgi:hypothetical protein
MKIIARMINIGMAIDVERVKDEVRRLNPTSKTEICKWIDEEAAIGLLFRIGVSGNRTKAAWHPKRRGNLRPPP